jgi:ribonuclease R
VPTTSEGDELAALSFALIARHSSEQEREAEAAAREATALKLAEYLSTRIGECFDALIVGVNSSGLYVREETTIAEGFIDASSLPAELRFEPERHRWSDPKTALGYRLGEPLRVILKDVEKPGMTLRFVIASKEQAAHLKDERNSS